MAQYGGLALPCKKMQHNIALPIAEKINLRESFLPVPYIGISIFKGNLEQERPRTLKSSIIMPKHDFQKLKT
jgi:hypothetical protein